MQPLLANVVQTPIQQEQPAARQQHNGALKGELEHTPDPAQRAQILQQYFRAQVARALGVAASRIDEQRSLQAVGLDSLMALELKNLVETDLGLALPVRSFLGDTTIAHLVHLVQERFTNEASPSAPTSAPAKSNGTLVHPANGIKGDSASAIQDHRTLPNLALPPALKPHFGRTQPTPTLLHIATASPLLVLQSEGQETPIFWIHAGFGDILGYQALARHLGPDRPCYAIQAPDPTEVPALYKSLPAMARIYLDLVRAHQPEGPYLLGGWSFGGAVAFEMAQQLWQVGVHDTTLIMLDTWMPTRLHDNATLTALFIDRICAGFGLHCPMQFEQLMAYPIEQQLNLALRYLRAERILDSTMPDTYLTHALKIGQATMQLLHGYQPAYYPRLAHLLYRRSRNAGSVSHLWSHRGWTGLYRSAAGRYHRAG
ncbi:MAG: hypothetical protein HC876_09800 [Chloroflexaceae bacterium]|nr:hypothetical protein [Chloroflexaceae bacterium]